MRMIESDKVIPLMRLLLMFNPMADKICENMQEVVDIHTIDAAPMPPCRMGDEAYGIKNCGKNHYVVHGKITAMAFSDDMDLMIHVKGACPGKWGETVFDNYEDARRALERGNGDG